ncbi:MAG: DUF4345 family protein [Pseudomonadales bacterium]
MMLLTMKILVGLIALLFLSMGGNLLLNPGEAAASFALTPVGEAGLNTLRSDFAGLFLASCLFLILGLVQGRGVWLQVVAILMLLIAAGRLLGFVVDGAPVPANIQAFVAEIVIAAILLVTDRIMIARSTAATVS